MITIRYVNAPERIIAQYGDNLGRVYLSTDGDTEIRLTKALDEWGELQQVKQEAALGFDLPATGRNRAILEQFRPDAVERNNSTITVEVTQDENALPLTGMNVLGFDESTDQYSVEVFGDSWLDEIEGLVLADLDLGTFTFTLPGISAAWSDRDSLAIPGLVDIGNWETPGDVTTDDLKTFWFSIPELLKAIFCHVGWGFESPHFEQGEGRYLKTFLPNTDEFWYEGKQSPRFVSTNVASPVGETGGRVINTLTLDDVYDPDNLYNNPSWPAQYKYDVAFENVVEFRIEVENFKVELPPSPAGEPAYYFSFIIVKIRGGVPHTVYNQNIIGSADQTKVITLNFEYIDEDLIGGDLFAIRTNYRNLGQDGGSGQTYTILSGNVYFKPNPAVYYLGDDIPLNNLLPSTITGKDFFEACAHLINGKVLTDYAAKKVVLYHPYTYFMQDDETKIQGFYLEGAPINLVDKTLFSSTSWEIKDQTQERFRVWKYQDSTDEFLTNEEQHIRRVDLRTGINKEKTSENPLFEPTDDILTTSADVGGDGITIPALWDNSEGEMSDLSSIGPRICNYYGLIGQDGNQWSYNGTLENLIPYLSMLPTIPLPVSVDFIALTWAGFAYDLYSRFYKREIEDCRNSAPYSIQLSGDDETYSEIDFRRTLLIQDNDSQIEVQPTAIKDRLVGSKFPLLIDARIK